MTIASKGRKLQRDNPGKYDPTEPGWMTGVWHELSEFDVVDAVGYAEELLRRANARLHESMEQVPWHE